MTRILFICHGNICRSPMAEFVMKELVRRAGRQDEFLIESAATSREELGNDMHYGTRTKLREMGIPFEQQKAMSINYKGHIIGDYVADIVVDNKIILELKSIPLLTAKNTAQLINYLAITGHKVGYLLNFGDKSEYKRVLRKGALNE
jgi:GxxExxY protein